MKRYLYMTFYQIDPHRALQHIKSACFIYPNYYKVSSFTGYTVLACFHLQGMNLTEFLQISQSSMQDSNFQLLCK